MTGNCRHGAILGRDRQLPPRGHFEILGENPCQSDSDWHEFLLRLQDVTFKPFFLVLFCQRRQTFFVSFWADGRGERTWTDGTDGRDGRTMDRRDGRTWTFFLALSVSDGKLSSLLGGRTGRTDMDRRDGRTDGTDGRDGQTWTGRTGRTDGHGQTGRMDGTHIDL